MVVGKVLLGADGFSSEGSPGLHGLHELQVVDGLYLCRNYHVRIGRTVGAI